MSKIIPGGRLLAELREAATLRAAEEAFRTGAGADASGWSLSDRIAVSMSGGRAFRGERPEGFTPLESFGTMPTDAAGEMALINALLPAGASPLTREQVHVRYAEAANNSYISDRYAFFDTSTLRNIAADADAGFALMNSHRFGGWYSPEAELPIGRSFVGVFESGLMPNMDLVELVTVGVYGLKGAYPNGNAEPGTDDIDACVAAGTIFDVSITVIPGPTGALICNVCNQPYRSCPHYRGWNDNMTLDEQIYARDVLGVPGGVATVRMSDWRTLELSYVYAGAVDNAGIRR